MFRTNANTIMGERACTASELFRRGCARKRRRPEEMSSLEKSIWKSLTTEGQEALPRRHSDVRTATRSALHFGAPGARHGKVLIDARPGRSRHRVLPAQEQSARQWYRRRPDASSEQTGTMGQLYSSDAFFSYRIIMYFAAGVCGVFSHRMWKAWCKKKKCGFTVWCRERPAWWGALVKMKTMQCTAPSLSL